jgi:hypothetical protein
MNHIIFHALFNSRLSAACLISRRLASRSRVGMCRDRRCLIASLIRAMAGNGRGAKKFRHSHRRRG